MITVTKSADGMTYTLDVDGMTKQFGSFELALDFLLDYGVSERDAQILLK